jgi:hypothetical protein
MILKGEDSYCIRVGDYGIIYKYNKLRTTGCVMAEYSVVNLKRGCLFFPLIPLVFAENFFSAFICEIWGK